METYKPWINLEQFESIDQHYRHEKCYKVSVNYFPSPIVMIGLDYILMSNILEPSKNKFINGYVAATSHDTLFILRSTHLYEIIW